MPEVKWVLDNSAKNVTEINLANISAVLALCYLALEKFDLADELLQSAKNMEPWDLDACKGTIDLYLYRYTGRFDLIPSFIDEYIKKYSSLYPAYIWMADHIQYYLYKPKESLEWYRKALTLIKYKEVRKYCESYFSSHRIISQLLDNYIEALCALGEKQKALSFARDMK